MIHSTAIIDATAKIAENVTVGPYTIIGPQVEIEAGTTIGPHVVIKGPTKIGKDNQIFQFTSLGEDPQDKKYGGEPTLLEIGDRNYIREFCTINRGTVQDKGTTQIGNDNWIMAYVHIAHDCHIGSHTIFANNASLAGHVIVEDYAILGGFSLVHQFCIIGAHSFLAKAAGVTKDVPPFVMAAGDPAKPYGLNSVGLKRRGIEEKVILNLKRAYRLLYRSNITVDQAVEGMKLLETSTELSMLLHFLNRVTRGIIR